MKKFYVTFILVLLSLTTTTNLFSQRNCHTMEYLHDMQEKDPTILQKMLRIENHTHNFEKSAELRSEKTIIIPVVFHVLFNTTSEKISEEVLLSQIEVLNEDFQRLNTDQTNLWSQAANVNLEFRLASIAPDQTPTNGMLHKFTNKPYFQANNDMKFDELGGSDAWPTDQYLNIWVCDLFGNKIGYAQFPGAGGYETEGVALDYLAVGRTYRSKFGLGRTATHEVGHWLNLRHIWGDGGCNKDDGVADTPLSGYPTFGCQHNKTTCGSQDMTANYMDYSNDECMNLFTEGQKARMRALFSHGGFRASLLQSPAFGDVETESGDIPQEEAEDCPNGPNCKGEGTEEEPVCAKPTQLKASFGTRQLNLSWQGSADAYTFELKLPNATQWYTFSTSRNQLDISGITPDLVGEARLKADCNDGTSSAYVYFEIGNGRLAQAALDFSLLAYPIPVSDELFVEWQQSDVHFNGLRLQALERPQKTFVELYDSSGRMVMKKAADVGQNNMILSVSGLNPGLYFLMHRGPKGAILGSLKVQVL